MSEVLKKLNNKYVKYVLELFLSVAFLYSVTQVFHLKANPFYLSILSLPICYIVKCFVDNYKNIDKRTIVVSSVFSALFSLALTAQGKITFKGNIFAKMNVNTIDSFAFSDIFRFLFLFIGIVAIYNIAVLFLNKHSFSFLSNDDFSLKSRKSKVIFWLVASLLVAVPIFIYLLANYPGFLPMDAYNSFRIGIGVKNYTSQQPVLFSKIVGLILNIGVENGNPNFGIAIFTISQSIIFSCVIGYFLTWLRTKNVRMEFIILTYLFFTITSFFSTYAIIIWKDTIFGCALLLMGLFLYDLVESNGEALHKVLNILYFIFLSCIIFFWRNNGLYILAIEALAIVLMYKKKLVLFSIINIASLVIFVIIQRGMYTALEVKDLKSESLAVPLLQVARTMSLSGDIASGDMEIFEKVIKKENMVSLYEPMAVDHLKWNKNFKDSFLRKDNNAVEYLKAWLHTLPKNFSVYVDSYLLNTYGFWTFATNADYEAGYESYHAIVKNKYKFSSHDIFEEKLGISMKDKFINARFIGSGTMLWIMIASISVLILKKKSKFIVAYLPFIGSWITIMLATPVAFGLRYTFMLCLALPLFALAPSFKEGELSDTVLSEEKIDEKKG